MNNDLSEIRKEIDEIDSQLLPLLIRRMKAAEKVAEIKRKSGAPVLNTAREEEILSGVRSKSGKYGGAMATAYSTFMDISRDLQHSVLGSGAQLKSEITAAAERKRKKCPRVICQGTLGAYSGLAADMIFKSEPYEQIFCREFKDVFTLVARGDADYGVIPVENSSAGSVHESFDLIMKYRLHIAAAADLPVSHCLCANEGAELATVRDAVSHPQALAQCSEYISAHGLTPITASNTAIAAQQVAGSGRTDIAAICSESAAKRFSLKILDRNIQLKNKNCTRFLLLSDKAEIEPCADKISLIFSLPHATGSLYRTLARFSMHGLNLTKLESRPIGNGDFQYMFYLDFTGSVADSETLSLLCTLSEELPDFVFLGNYRELTPEHF